jgi:hypothetical protein
MKTEINVIDEELSIVKNICSNLLNILPNFNITDEKILPYGLRPHTRSISWIVEQVIVQQMKYNTSKLGLSDVKYDMPDTCLHDCEIRVNENRYFVNIKTHNIKGKKNKNDISAVEKLYIQYQANPSYRLIYACFGIEFENINISFDKSHLHCFTPQFMPIYVNPRNDKIQATYHHNITHRTREGFLSELKNKSKSIILPEIPNT